MADVIIQTLRVQDDAEIRDVAGKQVARVRASKSQGKDKDGGWRPSIWLECEAWSDNKWAFGDVSGLRKGQYFVVQGRLSMREYTNKEGATVQAFSANADRIDVLAYDWPTVRLRVECGRGIYVRAIARDLGDALGVGGQLPLPLELPIVRVLLDA